MTKTKVRKLKKTMLQLVFLTIVLCSPIFAGGGKLTGKITDKKNGEPLISATVALTHIMQDGKEVNIPVQLGAATDVNGYYVILNVPSGEYTVRTSCIGYGTVVTKNLRVDPDRTINFSCTLEESTTALAEITVTAKAEVIKADVSGTQELISAEKIAVLPITRIDEYFGKLKGVQLSSTSDGYGLVIRGGAIRETDIRMDGISLQDPRSGNSYLGFNTTSINEIQVLTGGFEAKYGGIRSGLLDVKTKDGNRDRYTVSIKTDITPSGQYRFFGRNPFDIINDVYAGKYAWTGVPTDANDVPTELRDFKGWAKTVNTTSIKALDSLQRYELWKIQHPSYPVADKPDYNIEGTFTGPFVLPNTTFMAGFKYESEQYALPVGPRDKYEEWNSQLKLTSSFDKTKISVNGMYAKVFSNTSGSSVSYDASQRFSYLNNNTPDAINTQIGKIAGSGILSIYNKSRVQEFEQTFGMGGAKLTYVPQQNLYYTLEFQMGYTGQNISPMLMDMSKDSSQNYYYMYSAAAKKYYQFYLPTTGLPDGSTNLMSDAYNKFYMYGATQWADSSYSYNYQLKGNVTWQANRHNEVQAGFTVNLQSINVNAGSWNQSALAFTPNSWQYYEATPLEIGLYAQDKLEFEGLILNAGLRMDYFNPFKDSYVVTLPEDPDYRKLYTDIYASLGGTYNSYERWLLFRDLLDSPPGWPTDANKAQVKLSPRLGVAYPITENSKVYFNYGYFYQRPASSILYNMKLDDGNTVVPTPELAMARTIQYEFGYEQVFLENFLFNVTGYYKDVSDEPLSRTFYDYWETNKVVKYFPDAYKDIRGFEIRFERNAGKYVTFSAMYDYMIVSSGQTGYSAIYENLAKYRDNALRLPDQYYPQPLPRANINLTLQTPHDFGMYLGDWYANFFFEWKSNGQKLLNEDQQSKALQKWVDRVNYWNIDFRCSKLIELPYGSIELSVTVKNLTNNKWLITGNMTTTQLTAYTNELMTNGGKWGEYEGEKYAKVFENSWESVLFQNPRRIILGARINI